MDTHWYLHLPLLCSKVLLPSGTSFKFFKKEIFPVTELYGAIYLERKQSIGNLEFPLMQSQYCNGYQTFAPTPLPSLHVTHLCPG